MVFNLIIPEIDSKPNNTKDAVITLLTTDWPLSLKEIFYRLKKKFGYSSSYQAVFKAISELMEKKVVVSKDKKYQLNINWIKQMQGFTDIVETNYYAKERAISPSGIKDSSHSGEIMILNFETIFDAEKYLYYFMKTELNKTEKQVICHLGNNEWRPIFYMRAEYNYYKRLAKKGHKFYFICSGNSKTEQESQKFYNSIGVNFKIQNERFTNDMLIFSDYVVNIFVPEELKEKISLFLKNNDKMKLLEQVLQKSSSIKVMITKNQDLAKELKNQTLKKFR